jgi:GTPase
VRQAFWEFRAEVVILHHSTTLAAGYSPMMHIGVVTQAVRITEIKVRTTRVSAPTHFLSPMSLFLSLALASRTLGVVRQSVTGEVMDALRTGDRAIVKCRFLYRPELVTPGNVLLFREGRAKGVGRVTEVM